MCIRDSDQIEYLNNLRPIANSEVTGKPDDESADEANAKLFISIVMALAFALLTRADIAVYVMSAQRHLQTPTYGHIRKINTVVRWAQKHPKKVLFRWMACAQQLECHSDSGFRREPDKENLIDGRSARGANFLRLGRDGREQEVCHLLCLLYTSPSPRDRQKSRMPSSA